MPNAVWTSHDLDGIADMTLREVYEFYESEVDHAEYPSFAGWLWDMERSAVLYRHKTSVNGR